MNKEYVSVLQCKCCGYCIAKSVMDSLLKIGRDTCINPGGCSEPLKDFEVITLDDGSINEG